MVLGERGDVYGPTLTAVAARSRIPGRVSSGRSSSVLRSPLPSPSGCRRTTPRRGRGSRYVSPVWRRRCGPTLAAGAARLRYPRSRRGWRCPPRPRSAPRRPRPAGRRAVTSFRHAPCLAAPGVPLRCVVGRATAPGRDRPSAAVVPRASVLPVAPGLSCRLLRKPTGTPSPPLPDSAPGWTPGLASYVERSVMLTAVCPCSGFLGWRRGWVRPLST